MWMNALLEPTTAVLRQYAQTPLGRIFVIALLAMKAVASSAMVGISLVRDYCN